MDPFKYHRIICLLTYKWSKYCGQWSLMVTGERRKWNPRKSTPIYTKARTICSIFEKRNLLASTEKRNLLEARVLCSCLHVHNFSFRFCFCLKGVLGNITQLRDYTTPFVLWHNPLTDYKPWWNWKKWPAVKLRLFYYTNAFYQL